MHVEDKSPGVDPNQVLEMLKGLDRVKFNEHNQVFTYEVSFSSAVFELTSSRRSFCARWPT